MIFVDILHLVYALFMTADYLHYEYKADSLKSRTSQPLVEERDLESGFSFFINELQFEI